MLQALTGNCRAQNLTSVQILHQPFLPTLLRVTTATSNWCTAVSNVRPNFGDYIGSATGGSHVFPLWDDGRKGVPDTFCATLQGPLVETGRAGIESLLGVS
jgi:hypothetical protein